MNKECIICYKNVKEKSQLNLICECKYVVHNKCYRKWYKLNETCLICREYAYPPNSAGRIQLARDIKNFNVHDRREEPKIIHFMKMILLFVIIYYIFFKERLKSEVDVTL